MEDIAPLMIPTVAIVLGIGLAMLSLYFRHRQRDMIHRERLVAIEKGIEPPPLPAGFLNETPGQKTPNVYLLRGLIWFFLGVGIMVALLWAGAPGPRRLWTAGVIPTSIGIAYLIFYFAERKRSKDEEGHTGRIAAPIS